MIPRQLRELPEHRAGVATQVPGLGQRLHALDPGRRTWINAHINYDLAFTLRDVSIDPNRPSKRRDHNRINDILRRVVDVVQRALADVYGAEGYTDIDTLLGSFDEEFTLFGVTEARSLAWRNAVLLTDTGPALVRRFVD